MNKILITIIYLLIIQLSVIASDDKPITFEQLPKQSQQFVEKYFPGQSIALVKMERGFFEKSYELIFTNGNKIEFDRRGNWKEIDCKHTECPEELIPIQIRDYVRENYPGNKIRKIEKESRNGYEVELTNGTDLEFDSKFRLIDIDN